MKIVTVIPLKKNSHLGDLTYFTLKEVNLGNIVSVPLRNKIILGLVIDIKNVTNEKIDIKKMNFSLRKIIDIKDKNIFYKKYIESALATSNYFLSKKNNTVSSLIPSIFLEKYDEISKYIQKNRILKDNLKKEIISEKIIFQAPKEDRISYYKTLIRESFASKKSIFIVLPNEHDIDYFEKVLSSGISNFVFSMYSSLNKNKILKKITTILSTEHPVLILGTAPFLSIPRNDLDTIILEHENSNNYRFLYGYHIDLRTFVEIYASKMNIKLILADSILRFETIGRYENKELISTHQLSFRLNFKGEIEISNKNKTPEEIEKKDTIFHLFNKQTIFNIENNILNKKNTFIFTLRKGLATTTICKDCNETVFCTFCNTPVVLYLSKDNKKRIFTCNKCKKELETETKCKNCESWNLLPLGIGTDTVYEEINKLFPNTKIFILDKTNIKNEKEANKIISEFEKNKGSVLIGTEMAFFYMKEKVDLSIVSSFDSLWSIPNFKISERIAQLIVSLIEKTENKIIIQTKNEKNEAINSIKNNNLISFIKNELEDRKNLEYPPYKRFIKIKYIGNKDDTKKIRVFLQEHFNGYNPVIYSGFISKEKDKYSTNLLIKTKREYWSLPEIDLHGKIDEKLKDKILSLPNSFEIFVDPEDLL